MASGTQHAFIDLVYDFSGPGVSWDALSPPAQTHMKSYPWVPQNVTLFGNRVVADTIH